MKQFIVLSAVLPILMVFVMQTAFDQRSNRSISAVHDMVYAAKEEAREEGSFTPEIQERLRKNIGVVLGIPSSEISVACREEDGLLFYRVEAPIKNVIAGNRLFGIKDADNQYTYVISSYTKIRKAKELGPEPEPEPEPPDDEGNNEDG